MTEKKFCAPKGTTKEYKKLWNLFVPKVVERENFSEAHLQQLEILVDLYLEYHKLTKVLNDEGYWFESDSRYGKTIREHPCCKLRQKTLGEIRAFSKLIDLVLNKDMSSKEPSDADEWE